MNSRQRSRGLIAAIAVCAVIWPPALHAQRPAGADTLSVTAVAESLAVMRQLERTVRANPDSAALWYRLGMIAWALHDRDRAGPPVNGIDWTLLGRRADSSLRLAKQLDPRNARYALTTGQFFLGTGLVTMREQSYGMFGEALDIARATRDPLVHAEAAIEVGRVYWRRYDAVANGGASPTDATEVRLLAERLARDTAALQRVSDPERASKTRPYTRPSISRARQTLDRRARTGDAGFAGERDYMMAAEYLREAYDVMPTLPRAFHQFAMLLADRARWTELQDLATDQIAMAPRNPWAWMALGLAEYRLGATTDARAAFDSGVRLMSEPERERVERLDRVLSRGDSAAHAALTPGERTAARARYWRDAAPLWSRDDLDPHVEFRARVAFAELRWTVEELVQRGVDTDRGNIHVRYGPPDRVALRGDGVTWNYDYARLALRFHSAAAYGTATFADFGRAHAVIDSVPVRWDNLPVMRIDSIPVIAARFRATSDAMDVLMVGRIASRDIARAADVAAPVRTDLWFMDSRGARLSSDSLIGGDTSLRAFTQRVPYDGYNFRIEATASTSLVAGRAAGTIGRDTSNRVLPNGFGLSDVVIASHVTPRNAGARRWQDYDVAPLLGPLKRGGELSLLWENYELGARDGTAVFSVTVTFQRERSRPGRIAVRLLGNVANAVGRNIGSDRLELQFERSVPHAAAFADLVAVALGSTPAGSYTVTVAVTDRATGLTTMRSTRLVIAD
jgi:GWxTD domain-containing protein